MSAVQRVEAATALGALWHGDPVASAIDGFLTFGVAPFGCLTMLPEIRRSGAPGQAGDIGREPAFVISAVLAVLIFGAFVATGIGRLA